MRRVTTPSKATMIDKFKDIYRSETARLKNWDYSSEGYYFVTICEKNRNLVFGDIQGDTVSLTQLGRVHPETPDVTLRSFQIGNEDFFVLARKSRDCAEAYYCTPHKQARRLTPPGRKKTASGWKLGRSAMECRLQYLNIFRLSNWGHSASCRIIFTE